MLVKTYCSPSLLPQLSNSVFLGGGAWAYAFLIIVQVVPVLLVQDQAVRTPAAPATLKWTLYASEMERQEEFKGRMISFVLNFK
jgi:hypothetical protein